MKNLAIIPARGGSKRLPNKNIVKILNKPLVCYTIESAIASQCFDTIIFSSDSEKILSVARHYSELTVEKRDPLLAGDKVKVIDTVCEIVDRQQLQKKFDTISLLLPTCPFRRASDITNGISMMNQNLDAVVSATNFDFPIRLSFEVDDKSNELNYIFSPSPLVTGDTRSQDHKTAYRPNGAFYIAWWTSLKKNRNYFNGKTEGYVMPREYSIDIDEQFDIFIAEKLLQNNTVKLDF